MAVKTKIKIMKEITLKEWSAYLPYGLKLQYKDCINTYKKHIAILTGVTLTEIETTYPRKKKGIVGDIISFKGHNNVNELQVKPILYDLSWLTREIEFGGEKFIPNHDPLFKYFIPYELEEFKNSIPYSLSFEQYEKLLEWKFNVFSLPDELIVRVSEDFNPYK